MTLDSVPLHMTTLRWMGDVERSTNKGILHVELNNGNLNHVVCLYLSLYTYMHNTLSLCMCINY